MTTDNRKKIRLHVYRPVKVQLSDGTIIRAHLINLSASGAAMEFTIAGKKGTTIKLEFQLPLGTNMFQVNTQATVIHNHFRDDRYIVGVAFTAISEDDAQIMQRYLAHVQEVRKQGEIYAKPRH